MVIKIFDSQLLNYSITVIWVIGIMNSINMLDNMDGITSVTSLFIVLCGLIFLGINNSYNQYDFMILLGTIGSLIGFLFYNWHPSKMFMGDSGSQLLGLLIAAIGIKYFWNIESFDENEISTGKQLITVLIVFILPISDTTAVVINRLARKSSPFIGGKDHTTHHLSYMGFTDTQISFIFAGISFISCLIAVTIYRFVDQWTWINNLFFFLYFIAVFIVLYITTQQNKDQRK